MALESSWSKIFLVVIGVGLMIVFVLPAGMSGMAGSDPEIGTIDGEGVKLSDASDVRSRLQAGKRVHFKSQQGQLIPLDYVVFREALQDVESDDFSVFLLQQEAKDQGVDRGLQSVIDELSGTASSAFSPISPFRGQPAVVLIDDNETLFTDLNEQQQALYANGAKLLLDIDEARRRKRDYSKSSRVRAEYALALAFQQIEMDAIVLDAEDFIEQSGTPTDDEMQTQFETYRDVARNDVQGDGPIMNNPLGFGYQQPDRVKLQYVSLRSEDISDKVVGEFEEQPVRERVSKLFDLWNRNQASFPNPADDEAATQPATEPATQPTIEPATQPGAEVGDESAAQPADQTPGDATTQPADDATTQPADEGEVDSDVDPDDELAGLLKASDEETRQFLASEAEKLSGESAKQWQWFTAVYDDVLRASLSQRQAELADNVVKRLTDTLSRDYRQFRSYLIAEDESREKPFTPFGVTYDDPTYLEKLVDDIAAGTGVRPSTRSIGDFLSQEQLGDESLAGPIANAVLFLQNGGQMLSVPQYATDFALTLADEDVLPLLENNALALDQWEPSSIVRDFGGIHIFRLADTAVAEPAASLEQVRQEVEHDIRLRKAYDLAKDKANQIASAETLASSEYDVQSFGPFVPAQGPAVGELGDEPLSPAARLALQRSLYPMMPDNGKTPGSIGVIEIEPAHTILVGRITAVNPGWTSDGEYDGILLQSRETVVNLGQRDDDSVREYYRPSVIERRIGFTPNQ